MNLGEKLKAANEERARMANEAEVKKREADAAKFKLDNDEILNVLERVKILLIENIENGTSIKAIKLPKHSELFNVYRWKERKMIGEFAEKDHPHFKAFQSFFEWADENGLVGKFIYEHDGMGMESWYVATVEPK